MTSNHTTKAGYNIEAWRNAQVPRVTRAMLADELGVDGVALQKWERRGSRPNDGRVVHILNDRSIASHADWWTKSPIFERAEHCGACASWRGAVKGCARTGCPFVHKQEEIAA